MQIMVPLFSASTMDVFRCADFETAEMTAEKAHSPSVLLTSCIEAISCCVDCLQRSMKKEYRPYNHGKIVIKA